MKSLLLAATVMVAFLPPQTATAAVGVSINIGEPGFYGRIDTGGYGRPQLIYNEPVIYRRARVVGAPLYLHVPPGHAKNWGKHCSRYNACSRPVYFVDDGWYQNTYVPAYAEHHGGGHGNSSHHDNDHGDNNRGDDHGGDHGGGKSHGKGGKGHK